MSRHVFQDLSVFQKLIHLDLRAFHEFLEICQFKPFTMEKVHNRYWTQTNDEHVLLSVGNCLLMDGFLDANIGALADAE